MTEISLPFHDQDVDDPSFSDYMRDALPSGVVIRTAANELEVFGDSTGRQVKVRAGRANVRGHRYRNTTQVTLPIDENTSGQPRKDAVVLRLEYGLVNNVHLVVKKGVPGVSPSVPTLTRSEDGVYELLLGVVTVGNSVSTITPGNVSDERSYAGVGAEAASLRTDTPQTTHGTVPYGLKAITWNVQDFATAGMHSPSVNPSRIYAIASGDWQLHAKVNTDTSAFAGGLQFGKNGVAVATTRVVVNPEGSAGSFATMTRTFRLAVGDYLEVFSLGEAVSLDIDVAECFVEMRRVG